MSVSIVSVNESCRCIFDSDYRGEIDLYGRL